jgi:L-alanine-DL-glutamate epimerase-like enolase superfamily enzyme
LERGCTTVKLRLGRSLRWDTALVRDVRALLGDEIAIITDAKYNYSLPTAIRLAAELEACDVLYLEEPLPEYHLEAIAQLAAQTTLPLAYGEHTYTIHGFRDLIDNDVAVFQPDATLVGGLHEACKVAALAEAWGRSVSPHCGGLSAIGLAANVHLSASTPSFTVLEYDATPVQPMRDAIVRGQPFAPEHLVGGCLPVPQAPGLGVEVDEAVLADYPYRQRSQKLDTPPSYATPHL